jgi:hypothetical protein
MIPYRAPGGHHTLCGCRIAVNDPTGNQANQWVTFVDFHAELGSPALSVLVELVLEDWIGERPGLMSMVLCPCPLLCRPSFPACSG